MPRFLVLVVVLVALGGCGGGGGGSDGGPDLGDLGPGCDIVLPATCNGHASLCAKRYDEVAYATTHNAMSSRERNWIAPNQNDAVPRQLADGVRALMLDTHYDTGDVAALCHGSCLLGRQPLVDGLAEIEAFLACHPANVVTIIFETYVSWEDTQAAFATSGLGARMHAQTHGMPWPTLRELIDTGKQLVVFTDDDGGAFPGYHDVWEFAYETHFSVTDPDDFVCDDNRGTPPNDLFIFNHFLTNPVALDSLAEMVNHDPLLTDRANECRTFFGHIPNFVTVDFYDIGDVLDAVDSLNGI